ncbi:universal stress protein [Vibrio sp. HA2012]|uniref:universal stress protein n=1 Tax=Vibrio sp. HA2012 TaxID=1971595 RepID=UPI0012FDD157|nr:universal stress protein [Vibrio sp. HA2012]
MSYRHILVAVDLTDESRNLVKKAAALAEALHAELSFIHVDISYSETRPEQIVAKELTEDSSYLVMKDAQELLANLKKHAGYPIKEMLISSGNIEDRLETAIHLHNIDLVICGHHQDFWHLFMSSAKKLIQHLGVDILIIPIP